eukprot:11881407-Heterocapsa_arctica.AAC.1
MLTQPGSASLDAKRASTIDAFVHLHNRSRIDGRAPSSDKVEKCVQARLKANCTYSPSLGKLLSDCIIRPPI